MHNILRLCTVFPAPSFVDLKEGIFVKPQIQEVLKDNVVKELLTLNELRVWEAFVSLL